MRRLNLMHEINKVNPKLHHELKLIPYELLTIKYGIINILHMKQNVNSNNKKIKLKFYQTIVIINIRNNNQKILDLASKYFIIDHTSEI